MEDDIRKKSTATIIHDITILDRQIDLLILKHEKMRLELIRRFPKLAQDENFQSKTRRK